MRTAPVYLRIDLKSRATRFLLKNRETHNIPLSVMDSIVAEVQDLINIVVEDAKIRLHCVSQCSEVSTIKKDIEREQAVAHPSIATFSDLKPQWQQESYFSFAVSNCFAYVLVAVMPCVLPILFASKVRI